MMEIVALIIAATVAWVYSWPLWAEALLTALAVACILIELGADS